MKNSAIANALSSGLHKPLLSDQEIMRQRPGSVPFMDKIDGNFPAGQYDQSIQTAMAPFAGSNTLPTGQTINVSMNAPSPHLSFKEWAGRGIVASIGSAFAWPFQLVARLVEEAARMLLTLIGKLLLFVLLPTMLFVGYKLAMQVSSADSVEEGAAQMVYQGRHAAKGVSDGFTSELPPEKPSEKK